MNPAAFPAPQHTANSRPYTHTKRVARSSLSETTSPRPCNLVVNFRIGRERRSERRAFPGFFQDHA
jgi:hypothetical protein